MASCCLAVSWRSRATVARACQIASEDSVVGASRNSAMTCAQVDFHDLEGAAAFGHLVSRVRGASIEHSPDWGCQRLICREATCLNVPQGMSERARAATGK